MASFRRKTKRAKADNGDKSGVLGLSPNVMTNLLITDIALRGGNMLLRRGLERGMLGKRYSPGKARNVVKGRSFIKSMAGAALARAATTSIPGAVIVGGGLIAKALYDRRKGRTALVEGEVAAETQAQEGAKQEA